MKSHFDFYVGTHIPSWLYKDGWFKLFVSRRQMAKKRFKKAKVAWALDSGGFTELQQFGKWTIDEFEYADLVNTYAEEVGMLEWAAQQDWMCEPMVINGGKAGLLNFVGTKLDVETHQRRTVENFLRLRNLCKTPIIPVIQGYTLQEYHNCIEMFLRNGVDLTLEKIVGVGSICRRQATNEAAEILKSISEVGINIHGFGLKMEALKKSLYFLRSADSMAWSFNARQKGYPTCSKPIKNCANCYHAAFEWYQKIEKIIDTN